MALAGKGDTAVAAQMEAGFRWFQIVGPACDQGISIASAWVSSVTMSPACFGDTASAGVTAMAAARTMAG